MSYCTKYDITTIDGPSVDAFERALEDAGGPSQFDDKIKWYEHDDHIATAMLKTGTARVDLYGVGEENGDVWDKEYRLIGGEVRILTYKYRLVRDKDPTLSTLTMRDGRLQP